MQLRQYYHSGLRFDVLLCIFVVLKLCNLIGWSWYWVVAPFWVPLFLGLIGEMLE